MDSSDYSSEQDEALELEDNANDETFATLNGDQFDEVSDKQASTILLQFYSTKLKRERINRFQLNRDIFPRPPIVYESNPPLYFLPVTILLDSSEEAEIVSRRLINIRMPEMHAKRQNNELYMIWHDQNELVSYRLAEKQYKSNQQSCTNGSLMVDKLFKHYCSHYQALLFEQVSGVFLYWVYKQKLDHLLSEQCVKVLMISLFISLGLGVQNVVLLYLNGNKGRSKEDLEEQMWMDLDGTVHFDQQFLQKDQHHCIHEQKGFYMPATQSQLQICQIFPINFPLNKAQSQQFAPKGRFRRKSPVSILKAIFRLLTSLLSSEFSLTIDLRNHMVLQRRQTGERRLNIKHPVLEECLCPKLNKKSTDDIDTLLRHASYVHQVAEKNKDSPLEMLKAMFTG